MTTPIPKLPTDAEFLTLTHFPYEEGAQIEFKQSASKICMLKMEETLCGFLNGSGGHFVCGVNDKTCELNWMKLKEKDKDKIRLRVDQIYHGKIIHDDEDRPLEHTNLTLRFVPNRDTCIVIVTAIPTPGRTYRLYDTTWYRLNASNFRVREEKLYKISTVNQMISQSNSLIKSDYEELVRQQKEAIQKLERRREELEETFRNMNRNMMSLHVEMWQMKKESTESIGLLEKKILMEKAFIEDALERERTGCFRGWLGKLF